MNDVRTVTTVELQQGLDRDSGFHPGTYTSTGCFTTNHAEPISGRACRTHL